MTTHTTTPTDPLDDPRVKALQDKAQAVVDRWDSPLWKDLRHTGTHINELRAALISTGEKQMTTFTEEQIKYLETKINFLDEGDAKQGFSVLGNILGSVWGSILGSVEGDVRRSVWGSVLGSVRGSVLGSVQGNVWGSVKGSVLGNILGDVKGSVLGSVEGRVIEDVRADLVTPAPAVKVKTPVTAAQAMAQTRENYAETISYLGSPAVDRAALEALEKNK